jgi:hypothetical protein
VLPTAQQTAAVDDRGVARDGAHPRVGEGLHEGADGAGFEDRVAVDHDHEVPGGRGERGVERSRFARVLLPDHPHPGQPQRLHQVRGAVGGADVHHDDLHRVQDALIEAPRV